MAPAEPGSHCPTSPRGPLCKNESELHRKIEVANGDILVTRHRFGGFLFLLYTRHMERIVELTVTGMNAEGAAVAVHDGKEVFVMGLLPGERALVDVRRKKKGHMGIVREILEASPRRILPTETHHLSCGPWQTMEYALQLELKKNILEELFPEQAITMIPADKLSGYRTKIEFSFTDRDLLGEPAPLSLAFHERGGGARRLALPEGCMLASEAMNKAALAVVEKLRVQGLPSRSLKTLILRESKSSGQLLVLLYIKDEITINCTLDDIPGASGFHVYFSTPLSPASVITKVLRDEGEGTLTENIQGKEITYAADAFFQNNVSMFSRSVERMRAHFPQAAKAVELYSGVGTIGLLLADRAEEMVGIETVPSAVVNANENAKRNGITNYRAECLFAEKMDPAVLDGADVLILDPPRVGLHKDVIAMVRKKTPKTIIYLSCNPVTQARDYALLQDLYGIVLLEGYDFYPQTPHMESLLCLTIR